MKSTDFLQSAIDVQAERGQQYDSPEGERSMGRTVAAFNAVTGRDLTEAEGWLLLQLLKDVRQWQNPGQYHHDSALDGVAYASLKAEALHEAAATGAKTGPLKCWHCGKLHAVGTTCAHLDAPHPAMNAGWVPPQSAPVCTCGVKPFEVHAPHCAVFIK